MHAWPWKSVQPAATNKRAIRMGAALITLSILPFLLALLLFRLPHGVLRQADTQREE